MFLGRGRHFRISMSLLLSVLADARNEYFLYVIAYFHKVQYLTGFLVSFKAKNDESVSNYCVLEHEERASAVKGESCCVELWC